MTDLMDMLYSQESGTGMLSTLVSSAFAFVPPSLVMSESLLRSMSAIDVSSVDYPENVKIQKEWLTGNEVPHIEYALFSFITKFHQDTFHLHIDPSGLPSFQALCPPLVWFHSPERSTFPYSLAGCIPFLVVQYTYAQLIPLRPP